MAPRIFLYGVQGQYANYLAALEAAGGQVVLTRNLYRSFDCDGLLLPGGGDIDDALDATDHFLIQSFVTTRRPVLGICRGMQAVNVYFGGTLHRWIPGHQLPQEDLLHPTRACGRLAELLGPAPVVNSNHHQAVKQLGTHLAALQWAADGVVEGLQHDTLPVLGLQWHPERQSFALQRPDASDAAPVFEEFIARMKKHESANP